MQLARDRGVRIRFSITSNGTLDPEDARFSSANRVRRHDQPGRRREYHDQLVPSGGGTGSFARIAGNVRPLLDAQREMQVSARVTVTPRNRELPRTL